MVVLCIEDGIQEGAVVLILDVLPVAVEGAEELLEHGGGLLLAEAKLLHGAQGLPGLVGVIVAHVGFGELGGLELE